MLTDGDDDKKPRKDKFLQSLVHDKPVNSAYFSHVDGTRLLTTDQHRYGKFKNVLGLNEKYDPDFELVFHSFWTFHCSFELLMNQDREFILESIL